ncbi:MAG: DinB family protein [Candidatus Dormibacteria bacterium]
MPGDTVKAAEAYRAAMFKLAGDGDPSDALLAAPSELRRLVESAGADLRRRPAVGEWSVIELVGHMLDVELVLGNRMRDILAHDGAPLAAFDQDRWVAAQRYADADPAPLLAAIEGLRPVTVALYRGASDRERAHVGQHSERGPESFETVYRLLAGHDRFHMDQISTTLATVRGS